MIDLKRWFCYVLRMPRTYGFGVQSPFAYRFIREVVNDHSNFQSPRVCHGKQGVLSFFRFPVTVNERIQRSSKLDRRIYMLLLRLLAYQQPYACFVSSNIHDPLLYDMFSFGSCRVISSLSVSESVSMAVISYGFLDCDSLLDRMDNNGLLIVMGIRKHRKALEFWRLLISDNRTFVSFDLYDVGVIFFNSKMHKRVYCCNF